MTFDYKQVDTYFKRQGIITTADNPHRKALRDALHTECPPYTQKTYLVPPRHNRARERQIWFRAWVLTHLKHQHRYEIQMEAETSLSAPRHANDAAHLFDFVPAYLPKGEHWDLLSNSHSRLRFVRMKTGCAFNETLFELTYSTCAYWPDRPFLPSNASVVGIRPPNRDVRNEATLLGVQLYRELP
jgi:hypothetical protein